MNTIIRRRTMMGAGGGAVPLIVDVISNLYIASDGRIMTSTDWFYTTMLAVTTGQVVVFQAYAGAANSAIFRLQTDPTNPNPYTMIAQGRGSSIYFSYTWTATEDLEIGFSGKKGANPPILTIDGQSVTLNNY